MFCGTKSVGKVFEEMGYEVTSLDYDPRFQATHTIDITEWDYRMYPSGTFDVVWVSLPGKTWDTEGVSRSRPVIYGHDDRARKSNQVLERVFEVIRYYDPGHWFIQNPRGLLQHYPPMVEFVTRHQGRKSVVY